MAQTKKTVSELIQDTFCPTIAVLHTQDVDTICEKNKLTFVQLLQPFCRLPSELSYRDPSNNPITLKNFRLDIKDFNSLPTPNTVAKKSLDDAVASTITNGLPINDTDIDTEQYQLRIRSTTPWFDSWRDCFLRMINGGDHEFVKNYAACILVASTYEIDPVLCFDGLLKQQQSPTKPGKFLMTNVYNYFVLLHDVNDEADSKASSCFEQLKTKYGDANCHLLRINSKRPEQINADMNELINMPDPWRLYVKQAPYSQMSMKSDESISMLADSINQDLNLSTSISHPLSSYNTSMNDSNTNDDESNTSSTVVHGAYLTLDDHKNIRGFINEFITKGLLPWVETNLKMFNEQIPSRRGITKFFSMPKKLFGGNTSSTKNSPANSSTNLTNDSNEIHMLRCAGDLAFLFQNYQFAYATYYQAKRDLSKEQSPALYAGVLEMCSLSNFMQESAASKAYPVEYMEEAIATYIVSSRLPIFAIRCALMSTEILKSKDMYDEAGQQFLRVSQGDSDLANALFLEQASHCYLHHRPPFIRKYAFYMVVAGNRYLKAGQRWHALRCFNDVLNIYGKPNWSLALDHLNFQLAMQSSFLKHSADALRSFHALFAPNNRLQNAQQQINFFKEYLTAFSQLIKSETILPELPVPLVENSTIKILLAGQQQQSQMGGQVSNCNDFEFDETREIWPDLERTITAHDRRPSGTRTQMTLYTNRTHNQQHPLTVANETIRVEFSLRNILQVPLLLSEVQILWKYSSLSWKRKASVSVENDETTKEYTNDTLTEQTDQPVHCDVVNDCVILPNDTSKIELSLQPNRPGYLTILGITYRLNILVQNTNEPSKWPDGIRGKTLFHVKGTRLNSNRKERLNVMYGVDKRLEIQVVPEAPLLQIEFSPLPATMFCGEIQSCLVHLINTSSQHTISRVRLATSQPNLIAISSLDEENLLKSTNQSEAIYNHSINHSPSVLNLINSHHQLQPNSVQTIRLWLRAPHVAGEMNMDFMFVYESEQFQQPLRHRTIKHSALFIITHSIDFQTQVHPTGLGEIILPIRIDNQMPTQNTLSINIQQLSCISKQWTIENLSPISQNSIHYGENLSLLFKCRQRHQHDEHIQMKHIYLENESTNQEKYIDVSLNPLGEFFRHFISNIDSSHSTHRHKPSTVPPISLLLLWKIAVSNQSGQIEDRYGLHILSPSIDFLTTQIDVSQQIQFDLIYPSIIEHQFTKSLYLPIELKLFNQTNEDVQLQLQLLRSTLDSDPFLSSCCLWSGMTEQYLNLSAHEHLTLTLQACFFKPGFYTLGNITLALIDKLNSSLIPIKSNKQNYFIDIRTVTTN